MNSDPTIVTEMREAHGKSGRVSVYLDGRFFANLHPTVVKRLRLKVGRPAPPNLASRAAQEESQAAMRYAIRLLARQDRTTAELAQRLRRRCFAPEAVATVLSRLTRQGYLDDAKHAERLVNDRLTRNPHGRRAIEWMLRKKGVPGDIIQTCLDRHFQGVDETQMATELARRRLQRLRGLDEARVRNRLASFLSRRGFDYEAVRCALDRVLPDADE